MISKRHPEKIDKQAISFHTREFIDSLHPKAIDAMPEELRDRLWHMKLKLSDFTPEGREFLRKLSLETIEKLPYKHRLVLQALKAQE